MLGEKRLVFHYFFFFFNNLAISKNKILGLYFMQQFRNYEDISFFIFCLEKTLAEWGKENLSH